MSRVTQKAAPSDRLPDRLPASPRRERVWNVGFEGLSVEPPRPFESRTILGREPLRIIDMENLSPRAYPSLSVRRPREVMLTARNYSFPHGMALMDGHLYFVQGATLYRTVGEFPDDVDAEVVGTVENSDKHMVVFGGRLLIFPDKVYVDAADGALRPMEAYTGEIDGVVLHMDTITLPDGYVWSALGFGAGDGVYLKNHDDVTPVPEGHHVIKRVQGRVAYLSAPLPSSYTSRVSVRRPVPDLVGACVMGDRLCGFAGREILVSAAGNPFCWYPTLSDGAGGAALASNSEGDFTACAAWQGYAVFFKERSITRLLGSRADSFTLSEVSAPGIPAALSETLCEVGGVLYYHGDDGVFRYGQSGQLPGCIARLSPCRVTEGVGGSDGRALYLHLGLESDDGTASTRRTFVYVPEVDAWFAEDGRPAVHMLEYSGFLCRQDTDGHLWLTRSDGRRAGCAVTESDLYGAPEALVTFAPDCTFEPEGYRPAALYLRADGGTGGELQVLGTFGDPAGTQPPAALVLAEISDASAASLCRVPLGCRPCESLSLQLRMSGDLRVDALVREYEVRKNGG